MKIVHVFLLLVQLASSLFFEMGEKETKCFVEEIPEETMVVGKYNTQLFDDKINEWQPSAPGMGMHVEVSDPEQKVPSHDNLRKHQFVGYAKTRLRRRGKIYFHSSQTRRASDLYPFELHEMGSHGP